LKEVERAFSQEEHSDINRILNDAEAAMGSTDSINEIKQQLDAVESAANKITTAMLTMA
jgi:hypothetical protein